MLVRLDGGCRRCIDRWRGNVGRYRVPSDLWEGPAQAAAGADLGTREAASSRAAAQIAWLRQKRRMSETCQGHVRALLEPGKGSRSLKKGLVEGPEGVWWCTNRRAQGC